MMRPTPQSIPISALHQEAGAHDLVRSEKMRPYLELLKAHIGGQDTALYLAALAELPLEERYVWRVISALKWAFCDLGQEAAEQIMVRAARVLKESDTG